MLTKVTYSNGTTPESCWILIEREYDVTPRRDFIARVGRSKWTKEILNLLMHGFLVETDCVGADEMLKALQWVEENWS